MMRKVEFDPEAIPDELRTRWQAWLAKSERETAAACADAESGRLPPKWNADVWGELKRFLLENVFHGKCAYCELPITVGFFGDAEHYRPKGRVTVKAAGQTTIVAVDGVEHPGYYWLAYSWQNLFPSCEFCNSANGKLNQFPIAGQYVTSSDAAPTIEELNDIEEPLLLNPYLDNPSDHLRFRKDGEVEALSGSDKGSHSILVYDLPRESLVEARRKRQRDAHNAFLNALAEKANHPEVALDELMADYVGPGAPFSRACRDYLSALQAELIVDW